jgi:cell division protein FtsB
MNAVKIITFVLLGLLILLQYPLWFGNGGVYTLWRLKSEIAVQKEENVHLKDRNQALEAEVVDLKQGYEAIEERARSELGMVKKGETFFQVIEDPIKSTGSPKNKSEKK